MKQMTFGMIAGAIFCIAAFGFPVRTDQVVSTPQATEVKHHQPTPEEFLGVFFALLAVGACLCGLVVVFTSRPKK